MDLACLPPDGLTRTSHSWSAPRELDAAGIRAPRLRRAYLRSRGLHAHHGRTYFLATRLLTPARRPAVHALYGFARWVDDLVDDTPQRSPAQRRAALDEVDRLVGEAFRCGHSEHPVIVALVDTAERYEIDHALFGDFLRSMRMDLTVTHYPDRAALRAYIRGSAEVIGLQLLPVLGTVVPRGVAGPHAASLGAAFQLTNFLRDIADDLDRGRIYLPLDELDAFGVTPDRLRWCRRTGCTDPRVRRALSDQVARTRAVYRRAAPGVELLAPTARPCIRTAYTLYGGILDRIVDSGYNVFRGRLAVSRSRRLSAALAGASTAWTARAWHRSPAG